MRVAEKRIIYPPRPAPKLQHAFWRAACPRYRRECIRFQFFARSEMRVAAVPIIEVFDVARSSRQRSLVSISARRSGWQALAEFDTERK
jgi:hypothetical protein